MSKTVIGRKAWKAPAVTRLAAKLAEAKPGAVADGNSQTSQS